MRPISRPGRQHGQSTIEDDEMDDDGVLPFDDDIGLMSIQSATEFEEMANRLKAEKCTSEESGVVTL